MSVVVLFSLFVEINETCCALPLDLVNESLDYSAQELLSEIPQGQPSENYLAIYSLRSLIWKEEEVLDGRKSYHALRFKDARGKHLAFLVDQYLSLEEAIVQSVDSYIASLPGIQGATLRKDGSVSIVLNPDTIIDHALKARPFAYAKIKEIEEKEEVTLTDFLGLSKAS